MKGLVNTFMYIFLIQLSWITLAQPRSDREKDQLLKDLGSNIDDTTRVLRLQALSHYYVLKAGELKADMDTSFYYVKKSEILSNEIDYDRGKWQSLLIYSQIYRESDKRQLGKIMLDKAFKVASKERALWFEAECNRELSEYYDFSREGLDNKIIYIKKAVKLSSKGGSIKQEANLLVFLAMQYNFVGMGKEALICLEKAKFLYQKIKVENSENLYNQIAKTSLNLGLYSQAVNYGLLAIKQAEMNKFYYYLTIDYNTVGLAYYNMANYKLAVQYHQKGLDYELNNRTVVNQNSIRLLYNIINDYVALGKVNEAEITFKKYKDVIFANVNKNDIYEVICQIILFDQTNNRKEANFYVRQLQLIQKEDRGYTPDRIALDINHTLIEHFLRIKKYDVATTYMIDNKHILKKKLNATMTNTNQLLEFKLDSAKGNYTKAIASLKKYQKTKDSLFNEAKAYQIASLQIKYETDKKDSNIHLLTNESLIQKVIIEKDRVTKLVITLVLILFLIIICLLFRRYRSKIKSNKALIVKQNEIEKMNESLKLYVQEKELLLKEIHHRVKNNLQIVMSLLSSQSSYLTDKASIVAIKDSQHRIYSMSLIHQKLYQSEGICIIKMPEYIRELIGYLRDSYQNSIQFEINVDEIALDTTIAIPIGLIINEAITNTFKHAFPNNRKGIVKIQLSMSTQSTVVLKISDDGIGIPESIDTSQLNSLGMSLMEGLSREMNGNLKVTRLNGTTVSVAFPI